MTAQHYIPIHADLYQNLLVYLREHGCDPIPSQRQRACDLTKKLGESAQFAADYQSQTDLLGAELIEAVNGATGRQIETHLSPDTVAKARAALSEVVPALGNVVPIRAPTRDTQADIEAAAHRAVAEMPAPFVSLIVCEGRIIEGPAPRWAAPQIGSSMVMENRGAGTRLPLARRVPVLDVVWWVDGKTFEIHVGRADLLVPSGEVSNVG